MAEDTFQRTWLWRLGPDEAVRFITSQTGGWEPGTLRVALVAEFEGGERAHLADMTGRDREAIKLARRAALAAFKAGYRYARRHP